MHHTTIYFDPTGPAPIGFAQAAGLPGDIRFNFKTPGNLPLLEIAGLSPQLVLRPFTQPFIHAYDIVIDDPTGASGLAQIPGPVMNDRFSVEVYTRTMTGAPMDMIASGKIDLTGYAHISFGAPGAPVGPVEPPVVPPVGSGTISLDNTTVPAGSPIGTVVGHLSVVDLGAVPVFTLMDDAGEKFAISGVELRTANTLATPQTCNIVVRASFGVLVLAETAFTITVTPVVTPPTGDAAYTFFLHSLQY